MNQAQAKPERKVRAPRQVDDWHDRLIMAAKARHTQAVRNNNRDQNKWKEAVKLLEESRHKIYIPKTGQNAGIVLGIPPRIDQAIAQKLAKIAQKEEEILLPEHEGRLDHDITDESVVRKRNYRDSSYAVLAALWVEYQGPGQNPQTKDSILRQLSNYHDGQIEGYDHTTQSYGAWKGKDALKRKHLINEERGFQGMHMFSLTLSGAKACYYLFNEVFHPSKGNFDLVEPRHGRVDKDGNFYPHPYQTHATPRPQGKSLQFRPMQPTADIGHNTPGRSSSWHRPNNFLDDDDDQDAITNVLRSSLLGLQSSTQNTRNLFGIHHFETPSAGESLTAKRRRMVTSDPECAASIRLYQSWGYDEETAWSIYEQSNEQQTSSIHNSQSNIPKQSSQNSENLDLTDSQALEYSLLLSAEDAAQPKKNPEPESQDLDYLEAVQLSVIEEQERQEQEKKHSIELAEEQALQAVLQLSKQEEELSMKPSPWKVMDLTEGELQGSSKLVDDDLEYHCYCDDYSSGSDEESEVTTGTICLDLTENTSTTNHLKIRKDVNEGVIDLSADNHAVVSECATPSKKRRLGMVSNPMTISSPVATPRNIPKSSVLDLTDDDRDDVVFFTPSTNQSKANPQQTHSTNAIKRPRTIPPSTGGSSVIVDLSNDRVLNTSTPLPSTSLRIPPVVPSVISTSKIVSRTLPRSTPILPSSVSISRQPIFQRNKLYSHSIPPNNAILTLFVDQRERKRNNNYREFFKHIQQRVSRRCNLIGSEEVSLNIGDFMLAYVLPDNDKKQWVAEMAIERKCIEDIVSRSSEGACSITGSSNGAPHFRQERNLRNSLLKYPCFLIEGELSNDSDRNPQPRVPTGLEDQYLEQGLDIISSREELLIYQCGLLVRNYCGTSATGKQHRVLLLQTSNSIETSTMLAAISVIIADRFDSIHNKTDKRLELPEFHSFQKYWHGRVRNARQNQYIGTLECSSLHNLHLTSQCIQRIERRFGSESYALDELYTELCDSDSSRLLLLSDLSLSPSNLHSDAISRDTDYLTSSSTQCVVDSQVIAMLRCHDNTYTTMTMRQWMKPIINVMVYHNNVFDILTDSMKGYRSYVLHELVGSSIHATSSNSSHGHATSSSSSHASHTTTTSGHATNQVKSMPALPWCEIIKIRSCQEYSNNTIHKQRSSSMFAVILSGYDVIEALGNAIDELGVSPIGMDPVEQGMKELEYVRLSWMKLISNLPMELKQRWELEKNERKHHPQMIVLLDNLGRGTGIIGACGRLKNVCADASNAHTVASSSSSSYGTTIRLGKDRESFSLNAGKELTSKLSWIVNLFYAVGVIEYDIQPFHCTPSLKPIEVIGTLVNEVYRNAVMPYDNDL